MITDRALNWAEKTLLENNIPDSKLDAELLLTHLLDIDRLQLLMRTHKPVTTSEFDGYKNLVYKRVHGKPLAYITGQQEFMGYKFYIDENVLIPRPETELLVEEALGIILDYIRKNNKNDRINIIDMCAGSGNIAVSLAKLLLENDFGAFKIYASDISSKALEVTTKNARLNNVSDYIITIMGDLFEPFISREISGVDFIISNPPYVRSGELPYLQKEVQQEPVIALDAGDDGMNFFIRIINEAHRHLVYKGFLLMEAGEGQAGDINKLVRNNRGLTFKKIVKDYSGKDRIVVIQKAEDRS